MPWIDLCWKSTLIEPGVTVAILIRHFGFYSLNSSRVVYVTEKGTGPIRRWGFAYGTLQEHAESGEERFAVEWNQADDSVWYEVFAFSRPNHWLARSGKRLARHLQRRFIRESQLAMRRACN